VPWVKYSKNQAAAHGYNWVEQLLKNKKYITMAGIGFAVFTGNIFTSHATA